MSLVSPELVSLVVSLVGLSVVVVTPVWSLVLVAPDRVSPEPSLEELAEGLVLDCGLSLVWVELAAPVGPELRPEVSPVCGVPLDESSGGVKVPVLVPSEDVSSQRSGGSMG